MADPVKVAAGLSLTLATLLGACALTTDSTGSADDPTASTFRDCPECPEMLRLPPGRYLMGTRTEDRLIDPRTGKPATNDGPQHQVSIDYAFAIGRYEVSVEEYAQFVAATGHERLAACMDFRKENSFTMSSTTRWDAVGFPQTSDQPVGCVSWFDANAYASWLSEVSGAAYRLPTEAEWEYAARAGTTGPYHWGDDPGLACTYANVRSVGADAISSAQAASDQADGFPCDDGYVHLAPVGSFLPNRFGLHDMQGNAWEWVADCNHKDYIGAPVDGSAWLEAECRFGIIRGGSFLNRVERSSVTVRAGRPRSSGATNMGFRVARGGPAAAAVSSPVTPSQPAAQQPAKAGSPGEQLFRDNCLACHQSAAGFEGIYGTSAEAVEQTISGGGNNIMSMPAFARVLSTTEIRVLASYLRERNDWN